MTKESSIKSKKTEAVLSVTYKDWRYIEQPIKPALQQLSSSPVTVVVAAQQQTSTAAILRPLQPLAWRRCFASTLQKLVPEVEIFALHGKMKDKRYKTFDSF